MLRILFTILCYPVTSFISTRYKLFYYTNVTIYKNYERATSTLTHPTDEESKTSVNNYSVITRLFPVRLDHYYRYYYLSIVRLSVETAAFLRSSESNGEVYINVFVQTSEVHRTLNVEFDVFYLSDVVFRFCNEF